MLAVCGFENRGVGSSICVGHGVTHKSREAAKTTMCMSDVRA